MTESVIGIRHTQQRFTGERALFFESGSEISYCIFDEGESPLKHSSDIRIDHTAFEWKYPLWYSKNIIMENCTVHETGRAGIWYTDNITVRDTLIAAPKTFRRCRKVMLENCTLTNAAETLWSCSDITLDNVSAKGDYFAMNSENIRAKGLRLAGNYSFDGVKNSVFDGCELISKDSFWNTENVVVKNSSISGEYIGWNSRGLTFENCTIESLQGLCYIDGLKMINCRLINTTLSFEYSNCDAQIISGIDSVKNPSSGRISAEYIGELIMEPDRVDVSRTQIITGGHKDEV